MNELMGVLQNTWPILLMLTVIYFMLYRPNKRQQKRREAMLGALKRGSKILTTGGIYGEIVELEKETVIIKVAEKTEIRIARAAIVDVMKGKNK